MKLKGLVGKKVKSIYIGTTTLELRAEFNAEPQSDYAIDSVSGVDRRREGGATFGPHNDTYYESSRD